jgi:hypothetical protein
MATVTAMGCEAANSLEGTEAIDGVTLSEVPRRDEASNPIETAKSPSREAGISTVTRMALDGANPSEAVSSLDDVSLSDVRKSREASNPFETGKTPAREAGMPTVTAMTFETTNSFEASPRFDGDSFSEVRRSVEASNRFETGKTPAREAGMATVAAMPFEAIKLSEAEDGSEGVNCADFFGSTEKSNLLDRSTAAVAGIPTVGATSRDGDSKEGKKDGDGENVAEGVGSAPPGFGKRVAGHSPVDHIECGYGSVVTPIAFTLPSDAAKGGSCGFPPAKTQPVNTANVT